MYTYHPQYDHSKKVEFQAHDLTFYLFIIIAIPLTSVYVVERMPLIFFAYTTAYHKCSVSTFFEMAKAYHT